MQAKEKLLDKKLDDLSTGQLKAVAEQLSTDFRGGIDIIIEKILTILSNRLEVSEYIRYCEYLELLLEKEEEK